MSTTLQNRSTGKGLSLWADGWEQLKHNSSALLGLVFLATLIFLGLLAPWIAPYPYDLQNLELGATAPSLDHWMGTDTFGRDMLTRILYGGRLSMAIGVVATTVALVIGVLWGAIAGYCGGRIDDVMMRIVDILYALPFIVFIILLMMVFGNSVILLFIAIGAVEWLTMARIVRTQVLAIRQQQYVDAALILGLPDRIVLMRHIIPNTLSSIIVYTTLTVPQVMVLEAFLSFLGLGIQPPESSWGVLISYGTETMEEYPWLLVYPGLVFAFTLFSLNLLGDGLRDALDPRSVDRNNGIA